MSKRNVYGSVAGVGVDVHYKFSKVAMRDGRGQLVRRERLDHTDRQQLRRRLAAWPKDVPIVLEASFGWGWLADEMQAAGLEVRLSNCFKVKKFRASRGMVKTNEKDAALLSELPFEKTDWWRVWVAPAGVRNEREWLRLRMDLVGLQTATKNRISAIFHRHGIFHEFSDLFGAGGRVLVAELCREGRHLGVRGNRTLKWAFIEAAHGAVRRGGRWRAMFDRYTDGGKRNRNRGYIKVARALVKVVYVIWRRGVDYRDSPPPRPSGKQRLQSWLSRPGTGQPCRPMAAVR